MPLLILILVLVLISKINVGKDKLATIGEKLKESKIILIALGGSELEYVPFMTSRFDHSVSFASFQLSNICCWITSFFLK